MYMLQYPFPHFNAIKSVSRYQNTLYINGIQLIYIHKRTHMALSSVQHTVQTHFTFHIFLQTHFTLNWTLCEDHTSSSGISVQKHKSCLNCAQLCNLPFEIRFKVSFKSIQTLSACSVTGCVTYRETKL